MSIQSKYGTIPLGIKELSLLYPDNSSIANKAADLSRKGEIIRLKRGLYVTSPKISGKLLSEGLLANHIYGPSYVSMESALRYYGIIPERIRMTTSMTLKHTRTFKTPVGVFKYIQCNAGYYPIGLRVQTDDDNSFIMATPEKALCDLLMTNPVSDLRSKASLGEYLEENLRMDMDCIHSMHRDIISECIAYGKKKDILTNLLKLI